MRLLSHRPANAKRSSRVAPPANADFVRSLLASSWLKTRDFCSGCEISPGGAGSMRILITGGAGFVGSHLADELLDHGYTVRVLDNLAPQVHCGNGRRPRYLTREVQLVRGDVRDPTAVARALRGIDAVFHLAATVGVGQSMYEIVNYTSVNGDGTAV